MNIEFKPQKSRGHKHYRIKSDENNLILYELKKQKEKSTGKWKVNENGEYDLNEVKIGYFRSPLDMVTRLVEHDIMDTDDDAFADLPDVLKAWKELSEEITKLLGGIK